VGRSVLPLVALTHSLTHAEILRRVPPFKKQYFFKHRSCAGVTCTQSKSCSQCKVVTVQSSSQQTVRSVLVWLMHGNASILIAGDITVERLANPPVIIPTGAFWEGLEEYWSDLVNELPDIPNGGNHYFMKTLKPSLGQCPASEFCQPTRAFLHGSTCLKSHNMCLCMPTGKHNVLYPCIAWLLSTS